MCADCDLVVEAVPEVLSLKQEIFTELDGLCKPETILASNTSSISISTIAASTQRPREGHRHAFHEPRSHHEAR